MPITWSKVRLRNNLAFPSSCTIPGGLCHIPSLFLFWWLESKDCMTVTSKDGHFYYKASPKDEMPPGTTCGLFLITDPERQIEIELLHVDVSCEDGGLVSVSNIFHFKGVYNVNSGLTGISFTGGFFRWSTAGSWTANSSLRPKITICRWSNESYPSAAVAKSRADTSRRKTPLSSSTEYRAWARASRFASTTSRIPNVRNNI